MDALALLAVVMVREHFAPWKRGIIRPEIDPGMYGQMPQAFHPGIWGRR